MKVRYLKRRPLSVVPRLTITRRSVKKWRHGFYRVGRHITGEWYFGLSLWRVK